MNYRMSGECKKSEEHSHTRPEHPKDRGDLTLKRALAIAIVRKRKQHCAEVQVCTHYVAR
jgi:hypothetical protein